MAHTLESYLVELFPEAVYVNGGLDNGKWITDHYKINLTIGFFTEIESGKTELITKEHMKDTINRLKVLSNEKRTEGGR